ncbi:hypothetical protein B1757_12825 [Acidithiobacillus marinus]|uniref:DNA ligase n=1 Tax=Acidithiobacillus marinus TaxID=187490 RepID=A0A2I1DIY5_9PROT|nr:BRCT domain-containing protein [Acidithiobacillus marinus]PKY09827.1 hypothetical protein B1757_12825 [Acidithiobacillus marinus]
MEIEDIFAEIENANSAYRSGQPIMDDAEYDQKVEQAREIAPEHPFLNQVEPEPEGVFSGEKIRHKTPMLSTKKAYSVEEVQAFMANVIAVAQELGIPESEVLFKATPKLDGLSGRYDGAGHLYTRGNGTEGQDISDALAKGLVIEGEHTAMACDGEIVVDEAYFREHLEGQTFAGRELKHPRNFMVGFIACDEMGEHHRMAAEAKAMRFVPYSETGKFLGDAGFFMEKLPEVFHDLRYHCRYRTDGIVIEVTDPRIKAHMGATNSFHRWQIAYKQKGETAEVVVQSITWQVGRTGRVTPVLELDPVNLSGATIRRVTAHNAATVKKDKLGEGAVIRLIRSGEVIPAIEAVIQPAETIHLPESCPCCGNPLQWDGETLVCDAGLQCQDQVEGAMEHFCQTLEIDGFGPKVVEKLVSEGGISRYSEIFTLSAHALEQRGISSGVAKNLEKAIEKRKRTPVDDWRALAAFGFRHLGRGDAKRLLRHTRIGGMNFISEAFIAGIEGFGGITAKSIYESISLNLDEINQVISHLHIIHTMDQGQASGFVPLENEKMVFTGTFQSADRKALEKQAEQLGAKIQSAVNASTTLLVIGDKPGAKKTKAAVEFGTQTLNETAYLSRIQPDE